MYKLVHTQKKTFKMPSACKLLFLRYSEHFYLLSVPFGATQLKCFTITEMK